MNFLLASKISYTSARMLGTQLGLKVTASPDKIKKGALKLRYGCTLPVDNSTIVQNTVEAISCVASSYAFSNFCKQHDFNTPEYIPISTVDVNTLNFPILLRLEHHHAGNDIILVNNCDEFNLQKHKRTFVVPFVVTHEEIGIHIVDGSVVKIFKKVPNENAHAFIRSLQHGYHYKVVEDSTSNFNIAQDICLELFKTIGLCFGRADLGYNKDKKRYYIWEVNSAPGLNVHTAELYAKKILNFLEI